MSSLVVRFSCPALRTLQQKIKIFSLTSRKRSGQVKPVYDPPPSDESGRILSRSASAFKRRDLNALRVNLVPADEHEVIPNVKGTNYIITLW